MRNILVTGGAGFIGSNFVLYWLQKYPQDKVVNLDKLTYAGNLANLEAIKDNSQHVFIKGDITDRPLVDKILRENAIDTIVHFAAESHVDRSILDPSPFIKTNIEGTYVLLEAALKYGHIRRFHHISTDEVFGSLSLNSGTKFTEDTAYDPKSPYSASKASSDHLVRAYAETYKLPITLSNCSNNFGPFHFPEKLIPLAITNILEGKKVPVYGDGLNVRDWLYVEDHCRAIDLILEKGQEGETYLIGGLTKDIPNIKIVKLILKLMGKNEDLIEYVADRPGHDRRYSIDWNKIHTELGWSPQFTFEEYLAKTIDWYKTNTKWWQDIKNGSYKEYYQTQYGK